MTAAPDWVTLLERVLAGAPSLPGAKCRGRAHMFDGPDGREAPETTAQRHAQATLLCLAGPCPALGRCPDWMDSLKPSKRPSGVVCGLVWEDGKPKSERPPGRPRKAAG